MQQASAFASLGTGPAGASGPILIHVHAPRDRVSVAQLRKMGHGELAMGDLNRDGWLDTDDVALWLQGVRPEGHAGDPSSAQHASE